MKINHVRFLVLISLLISSALAFAADAVVPVPEMPLNEFFASVLAFGKGFSALSWQLKVSGSVALLISTVKVSFLRPAWDKMGWAKFVVAPALGFVGGLFAVQPMNAAGIMAWTFAGAGAIVLHELMDGFKAMPGIKPLAVKVIDMIKSVLKAPAAK